MCRVIWRYDVECYKIYLSITWVNILQSAGFLNELYIVLRGLILGAIK